MTKISGVNIKKWRSTIRDPMAKLYLYGKTLSPERKRGHVTRILPKR